MEYKTTKKIKQIKKGIEADIPCNNLTLNWYKALAPTIVYANNDIPIPEKWRHKWMPHQR